MRLLILFGVGIFCSLLSVVQGRWIEGNIETQTSNWEFIARFCFLSKLGSLSYTFEYPVSYGTQEILLYFDEPGQWESVYRSNKNCSARRSVLSLENNQVIALNTSNTAISRFSGCTVATTNGQAFYSCSGIRTFRSMRERWWYIVVARCDEPLDKVQGLKFYYKLHLTNGEENEFLQYEYSADEFYIFPEDMAYLVAYIIMMALSIVCAVILRNRQLFHSSYKLYMASLSLWLSGLILLCIAWGRYGQYGWQEKPTEVTGRIFQAASTIIFILMVILMAKGYTITRGRLTSISLIRLSIFFSLFIIIYCFLFIWEGLFFDEGLVLYYYESPPGYGLIAMRLVAWLWFLYALFFTLKHHPSKRTFYLPFFIIYTLWFWAGPVVILAAMFGMPKWSREKTINAVEQFVGLCGHLFFLILTRPQAANKNFPYHVKTSQIGILSDPADNDTITGSSTFRSEAYATSSPDVPMGQGPNLAALFIVQFDKTRDENMNREVGQRDGRATIFTQSPPPYSPMLLPQISRENGTLPPVLGFALPPIQHALPSAPPI
ncbi:transmembrane protein 145-like isoform X1 [Pomacea canaliculata]|uniref:transmembrane protein 145-like isoform X1 n=1 Tax=Pomacea canaliculata TaxID=400727 RepID=UPI000D737DE2|nr:transmembrane protein 145-like isoform X1 [Pomacea canaliculata]